MKNLDKFEELSDLIKSIFPIEKTIPYSNKDYISRIFLGKVNNLVIDIHLCCKNDYWGYSCEEHGNKSEYIEISNSITISKLEEIEAYLLNLKTKKDEQTDYSN